MNSLQGCALHWRMCPDFHTGYTRYKDGHGEKLPSQYFCLKCYSFFLKYIHKTQLVFESRVQNLTFENSEQFLLFFLGSDDQLGFNFHRFVISCLFCTAL